MPSNGLQTNAVHQYDEPRGLMPEAAAPAAPIAANPETAARQYLDQYMAGTADRAVTAAPTTGADQADYQIIGTETVPLTGTTTVKFYQRYYKIPVYGSLITVELDQDNTQVGINSALGNPTGVDPVAKISPQQAQQTIQQHGGDPTQASVAPPRLYFYYDGVTTPNRWRLVYITVDVPPRTPEPGTLAQVMDYVVDAHDGTLVATLPRVHNVGAPLSPAPDVPAASAGYALDAPPMGAPDSTPTAGAASPGDVEESARDGLNQLRRIRALRDPGGQLQLVDRVRNVRTYDNGYRSIYGPGVLPGQPISNPPAPWNPAAVSAHANASVVADYYVQVLQRRGVDNRGGAIISSINCVEQVGSREWANAAWLPNLGQMVYGQRMIGGALRSYALSQDVVGHEITHGVTDQTARLVYSGMSGALNESYSDIFGILISNAGQADVGRWNWEIGEDLDGHPLRDLRTPTLHNQPDHMRNYRDLPLDRPHDYGGVHYNSGIHNKVAYLLLTTLAPGGGTLCTPKEVATLFYLALTQQLSRTSGFADSRRGVLQAAKTFFRRDTAQDRKVAAVAKAFADVGIV